MKNFFTKKNLDNILVLLTLIVAMYLGYSSAHIVLVLFIVWFILTLPKGIALLRVAVAAFGISSILLLGGEKVSSLQIAILAFVIVFTGFLQLAIENRSA